MSAVRSIESIISPLYQDIRFYKINPLQSTENKQYLYPQLYPSLDETLMKFNTKCHAWSLGLLRCAASSIATGDIWVSEERITRVHQIRPSRPTGCLRHGNVQCVPQRPIKRAPEPSPPIRTTVRTVQQHGENMQSSQQVRQDYKVSHATFKKKKKLRLTLRKLHLRYLVLKGRTVARCPAHGSSEGCLCHVW